MKTYRVQDRGYDCNQHGALWDVTAKNMMGAIRQLDGFQKAAYAQPINDIRGCSTYAVYERALPATHADWNKIGVVYAYELTDAVH